MSDKTYTNYFFEKKAFDDQDGTYIPLENYDAPEKPLVIPPLLKPDKEIDTDLYYAVTAQAGETQFLPGEKNQDLGL